MIEKIKIEIHGEFYAQQYGDIIVEFINLMIPSINKAIQPQRPIVYAIIEKEDTQHLTIGIGNIKKE